MTAGFVGGFIVFLNGFLLLLKKRLIENLPASKIRSLAMGLVKLCGEVESGTELLKSPFFLKDCIYYRYVIERRTKGGRSEKWETLKTESESVRFLLRDETGSILVDPAGAEINTNKGLEWSIGGEHKPSNQEEEFLAFHGIETKDLFGLGYKMRYREYFIEPSDALYILGTAADNPSAEDGSFQENVEDIMIQKGGKNKPYIISEREESEFLRRLSRESRIRIIGGALISIFCLIMLFYFTYYIPS